MQTTVLVIENVIGGSFVFLWMGLAVFSLFGFELTRMAVLKEWMPSLFLFLASFVYALGIIFDRLWDILTKKFDRPLDFLAKTFGFVHFKRDISDAQRLRMFSYNEQTERFFDYLRGRLRIARATFWNAVFITVTAFVFVWIQLPDGNGGAKTLVLSAIVVSGIGLSFLALVAFLKIRNTYNEQLYAAEEAFFPKKSIFTPQIQKAIRFSAEAHKGQMRKVADVPYIVHPLSVGMILARTGASEDVIVAGFLHDTIEESKGRITKEIIEEKFGPEVARMVNDVTEQDTSLPWAQRKQRALEQIPKMKQDSQLIKSADALYNMTDLLHDVQTKGDGIFENFSAPKEKQIQRYARVIDTLEEAWQANSLLQELKDSLQKLRTS